jgi:hypothetical protein
MLRALTNLADQSNISGTFQSLEGAREHVPMTAYHQMLPAVNVNPGYTVPPITRPRGYLKQKRQKKIQLCIRSARSTSQINSTVLDDVAVREALTMSYHQTSSRTRRFHSSTETAQIGKIQKKDEA